MKKKPFWKKLLITKKTVDPDPVDKNTKWITVDVYNPKDDLIIIKKTGGKNGNKNS
tara:strand:- start:1945 stop:2112 length:168 start_codon:yes stop_codon:yes gene_type:complete